MENSKVRAKHGNAIIYSNVELHCKYTICNKQNILGLIQLKTKTNKLCGRPPQYAPAACKLTFDLLTLKVVYRVTCDVAYVCTNFSLPRKLCSRLTLDVRDRQMSDKVRQKSDAHHRLMSWYPRGGGILTGKRVKTNQKVHTALTDCISHTFFEIINKQYVRHNLLPCRR